jgi:hypothetical protein
MATTKKITKQPAAKSATTKQTAKSAATVGGFDITGIIDQTLGNGDGKLDLNDAVSILGKLGGKSGATTTTKSRATNSANTGGIDIGNVVGSLGKLLGGN